MRVVVDASVVVAALVDSGPVGTWAESFLTADVLTAPHLLPVEVSNCLRRATRAGNLSPDLASIAHTDLASLRVDLYPFAPFSARVWDLRSNLTAYDAWYVALAEHLDCDLATIDTRLVRSPGPRCGFLVPEAS